MENQKNSKIKAKSIFVFAVSMLIILGGFTTAWYMISTAPVTKPRPPAPLSALVKVQKLEKKDSVVKISAMGTTLPVQHVALKPKVTGIVKGFGENYGSGCIAKDGDPLVYLEDIDQKADFELAQASLMQSKANLAIEVGSQAVAKRELDLLQKSSIGSSLKFENQADSDLALRKPQLEIAQAEVKIAEANLETAKNDLGYTVVKAPFNAFIDANVTSLGMLATPTTSFGDLYGTDSFWVDATVTFDALKFLEIPMWSTSADKGSLVEIHVKSIDGKLLGTRIGDVRRMRSLLQDGDNMVRLMIRVEDPLCLKEENKGKELLLLGAKVDVEIHAKELKGVYEIPRAAWREDKEIWIVDENKKLKKIQPKLIWKTRNAVYIDPEGIAENTQIITSTLSLAVNGLALNIIEE